MNPITHNKATKESFEAYITNGGTAPDGKKLFATSGELRGMLDLDLAEILQHRDGNGPTACAGPAGKSDMAKLESDFNACKAAKASAKPGTPMPVIACMSGKAQEARQAAATADLRKGTTRQASAELDRLKAENMTLKAKIAPAKPATLTAAAYLASVAKPTMTRAEFSRLPRGEQGKAIKTITLVP